MPVEPRRPPAPSARPAHGSVSYGELRSLGLDLDNIIDFSVNTNPLGPSPRVREAVLAADIARYPDTEVSALRCAIAQRLRVAPTSVLVGNGSTELVWLAAQAYLAPGDTAVVAGPTFGEYEHAAGVAGAVVQAVRAGVATGFALNLDELSRTITRHRARVLFLCTPNNPTGVVTPPAALSGLAERHPDTLVVVDEAYLPFAGGCPAGIERSVLTTGLPPNLLVLRSLTKDCAIPGLRLGFAVAPEPVIAALASLQPTWSVNALAQAAGLAALDDTEHWDRSVAALAEAKDYLETALTALGLTVHPSAANFLLVDAVSGPGGFVSGGALRSALLREGCCLRACASFGLPEYVRIGVRTLPECRTLVAALRRVLNGSSETAVR